MGAEQMPFMQAICRLVLSNVSTAITPFSNPVSNPSALIPLYPNKRKNINPTIETLLARAREAAPARAAITTQQK